MAKKAEATATETSDKTEVAKETTANGKPEKLPDIVYKWLPVKLKDEELKIKQLAFLRAFYEEPDTYTEHPSTQHTRKWYISEHAVESEIVQTALKCVLTSVEHRVRESFLYKGERVFGPHFDVNALVEIAKERRLDYRGKKRSA